MTATSFITEAGVEVPAITTHQMREVDRVAMEELGPNLYQMMENAGRNLALTVLHQLGGARTSAPILVLAGTGGNGGGGICAARHLANRGMDVTLVISNPHRLGAVTGEQLNTFRATNGVLATEGELGGLSPEIVIDAIIGYSLGGPPRGAAEQMIEWAGSQASPVVALDVPSGIDATSGETPGAFVQAATTVTLALPKTGLDSPAAGDVYLADIGIPVEVFRRVGLEYPGNLFGEHYRVGVRPV